MLRREKCFGSPPYSRQDIVWANKIVCKSLNKLQTVITVTKFLKAFLTHIYLHRDVEVDASSILRSLMNSFNLTAPGLPLIMSYFHPRRVLEIPTFPLNRKETPTFPYRLLCFPVGIPYSLQEAIIPYCRGIPLRVAALPCPTAK